MLIKSNKRDAYFSELSRKNVINWLVSITDHITNLTIIFNFILFYKLSK